MTRKHKTRNHKTIPIVKVTVTGLSGTLCSVPNIEAHKIDHPINVPVSLAIVTIVY